jgi:GNAT superfamily N-acetyltransferase
MALKTRLMEREDISELSKIYAAVYSCFDVGETWTPETAKRLIEYWHKRQPDLAFVAEWDKILVGAFVAGIKPWCDGNHLVDGEIFVHPEYQNRGVGTELSKTLYRAALEKYNAVGFDTYTFKHHSFPLSWYKAQGFRENQDWVMIEGDVQEILSKLDKKGAKQASRALTPQRKKPEKL